MSREAESTVTSERSAAPLAPVEPLVLTPEELAKALGISRAHLFRLHSRGLLPRPLRFGRSLRWDRSTVTQWLAAGAPSRDRWEATRSQQPRRG
jgi:excisionase family DNA binding protein